MESFFRIAKLPLGRIRLESVRHLLPCTNFDDLHGAKPTLEGTVQYELNTSNLSSAKAARFHE